MSAHHSELHLHGEYNLGNRIDMHDRKSVHHRHKNDNLLMLDDQPSHLEKQRITMDSEQSLVELQMLMLNLS
jgi:hypothetical protein